MYYNSHSVHIPYRFGDHNLYWCDKDDMAGFGPFSTLHSLMQHYEKRIHERRAKLQEVKPQLQLIKPEAKKVIMVDFKNKKKIIAYES